MVKLAILLDVGVVTTDRRTCVYMCVDMCVDMCIGMYVAVCISVLGVAATDWTHRSALSRSLPSRPSPQCSDAQCQPERRIFFLQASRRSADGDPLRAAKDLRSGGSERRSLRWHRWG